MNSPSLYLSLCTDFFDLDKPIADEKEYAFYLRYVRESKGPILEPMCGTGRYLIPMTEQGYTIDGFDASPFMLNALKKKCSQKNISPFVWEHFLENVHASEKYNLIFIPDSSFCLFLKTKTIMLALEKIYSLLKPGGIFIFDLETIYSTPAYIGVWQGKMHTKENGQHLMQSILPLPITNNIATVMCRYELIDKTNIIKTEIEHFQIKLYEPKEMDSLLLKIGFTKIRRIKTYSHNEEPSLYDHTIAYECTK